MGRLIVGNLYGGDLMITSACKICGKEHSYRLKERQTCPDEKCYQESKKRKEKYFTKYDR